MSDYECAPDYSTRGITDGGLIRRPPLDSFWRGWFNEPAKRADKLKAPGGAQRSLGLSRLIRVRAREAGSRGSDNCAAHFVGSEV